VTLFEVDLIAVTSGALYGQFLPKRLPHYGAFDVMPEFDWIGNPPFLTGCIRRTYAAIFSFWAGVMPPMPMFGRSLLQVQSHCVA
jgi:hypothetical protein